MERQCIYILMEQSVLYSYEAAMCLDSIGAPVYLYANEATVFLYSDGASLCYILMDHQYIIFLKNVSVFIFLWSSNVLYS